MSLKNKNTLKNKNDITSSTYIIEDDNDSSTEDNINWSENENHNNEECSEEELNEDDEIVNLSKLTDKSTEEEEEDLDTVNDVTYEITKDKKNNKCVKVSVSLNIEKSNDIINIEFLISKEMCLKLANQLK
jgi:hypothetical protein